MIPIIEGLSHTIFILDEDCDKFQRWFAGIHRPEPDVLKRVMQKIADTSFAQLQLMQTLWVFETRGTYPVYAIKRDQARLYCCLKGQDIVILAWDQKKRQKADRQILEEAVKRAKKVLNE